MRSATDTNKSTFNVLLIEDNIAQANLMTKRLTASASPSYTVRHAVNLEIGLGLIALGMDVILLDLSLPDSQGLETFLRVHEQAPETPIIILSGIDDEALGLEAVSCGAQDYLIKGKTQFAEILRILRYAIERNRKQVELRKSSLTDDLTGLQNRRGFRLLAEQELKQAHRVKQSLLFFFVDVDKLKEINDTYGHESGDQAIKAAAAVLKEIFRRSDILARVGGDEFAVLAIEASKLSVEVITTRLEECVKNIQKELTFQFTLSWGASLYDFNNPRTFDELMVEADQTMYRHKDHKSASENFSGPAKRESEKKILIIEDDPAISKMLYYRLKESHFEVFTAADGVEGLAQARRRHPDLIILDLGLPKLPGEEVCKAIREDRDKLFAKTPVIMLTAKSSDVDRVIGNVIGATYYITKPFVGEELLKVVRKLTRGTRDGHGRDTTGPAAEQRGA